MHIPAIPFPVLSNKIKVSSKIPANAKRIPKVLSLKKVLGSSYSSAGLTDETLECFYAKVDLAYNQKLDTNESISFQAVELDKLPQFVKTHKFCLPSALMLKNFYLETKLKQAGIQK